MAKSKKFLGLNMALAGACGDHMTVFSMFVFFYCWLANIKCWHFLDIKKLLFVSLVSCHFDCAYCLKILSNIATPLLYIVQ